MIIAVDTGGTKTLVARVADDGTIEASTKFPTPTSVKEYAAVLKNTIAHIAEKHVPSRIVVAMPGIVKNDVTIWCFNLGWADVNVKQLIGDVFPGVPIHVENDANLAGLGETHALKKLPKSSLYVTISTGIGTGIIEDGYIDPALRGSEGGHMLLEFDDELQVWEHFASGKAIYNHYGMYARDIENDDIWRHISYRMSLGFLAMIPMIQPDIIIIGGSIGTYFDRYARHLETILEEKLPPHLPCPHIVAAQHPEEAVIYGCHIYATQQ